MSGCNHLNLVYIKHEELSGNLSLSVNIVSHKHVFAMTTNCFITGSQVLADEYVCSHKKKVSKCESIAEES